MGVPGRPEDSASTSPLGRRMAFEQKNPRLVTRAPSQRDGRQGWDVVNRKDGTPAAGPWDTVDAMLAALEQGGER